LLGVYIYAKRKKKQNLKEDMTVKTEVVYKESTTDDKLLWSNEADNTMETREFDLNHKIVPKPNDTIIENSIVEPLENKVQEVILKSNDLLDIALEFDNTKDRKGTCYYLLEAFKIETNEKEKIRLRLILTQYKENNKESLSDIIEKLPTFTNVEINEANKGLDNLMNKIAQEATKEDEIAESVEDEDSSKKMFLEEFGNVMNEIHKEVHTGVVVKKEAPLLNKIIWVNWMVQNGGKTALKNSMLEIVGDWGTKNAVEQVKTLLDKEAGISSSGQQNTWSILSVLPLND
jgi:hypothetical protein